MTIDPLVGNDASFAIARKIPGMTPDGERNFMGINQHFFTVTREQWLRDFGLPGHLSGDQAMAGKELCIYCMNLRTGRATVECEKCGKAKYCSKECRSAHWDWPGWVISGRGHRFKCKGKSREAAPQQEDLD